MINKGFNIRKLVIWIVLIKLDLSLDFMILQNVLNWKKSKMLMKAVLDLALLILGLLVLGMSVSEVYVSQIHILKVLIQGILILQ